jgi:hypothetical protein
MVEDFVPAAVQEKLAPAGADGFFIIHLGHGKAALAALSNTATWISSSPNSQSAYKARSA